jgi:hypothetical protein
MTTKATELFQYLRGAVRSAYGTEDFRGKSVLFIGMDRIGQELLLRLCLDEVSLFFADHRVTNYYQAHAVCGQVSPHRGEPVDITVDFENKTLVVKGKSLPLPKLGQEAYTQGIHDFYL